MTKQIAFIVKYFPSISETFIVNQINGLLDEGYQVKLYAYQQVSVDVVHDSLKKHQLLQKVQYFVKAPSNKFLRLWVFLQWTVQHITNINWHLFIKTLNVFKYGKDAYTLKLFFEAQWFLVHHSAELIHAHFGMNGNRIAYLKAKGIISKTIPLITTFHGYDLEPNKLHEYRNEYAYLFKESNSFTVNTPYLESLLQQVNTFKKPCYVLPVGLDTYYFTKQTKKSESSYFDMVYCGKLISLKGPDTAIIILKQLHDEGHTNVRLHLIGDGEMRELLETLVEGYHLQEAVFFYGKLSQEAIKQTLEQADVFYMPGRYDTTTGRAETQGLVIQEAQAMELPVVVSQVGGMMHGVLHGKTGYVIKDGAIADFVKVIETLINDKDLRLRMGKAGREFVVKHYDNKVLVRSLIQIYNQIN